MQKKRIMRMINKNFDKTVIALSLAAIALIVCIIIVFTINVKSNTNNDMVNSTSTSIETPITTIESDTEFISDTTPLIYPDGDTTEPIVSSEIPITTIESETSTTEPQEVFVSLGEYRLTAYCPCAKCCGKWGENRPTDANGNVIVITASGRYAKANWTVAADTSILPFGTRIYINGCEYEVQDRGGGIKGNRIDIYFDDHQEALNFGVRYAEVMIKIIERK